MKTLLYLYPPSWRSRYGPEIADLLDDEPFGRSAALDLARGAVREWVHLITRRTGGSLAVAGGSTMLIRPFERHPTSLGIIALAVVTPTLLFVGYSLLAYGVGIPALADAIGPAVEALTASDAASAFIVVAPLLALGLALLPLVGLGIARAGGELQVTLALRGRALNLVVVVICVVLAAVLLSYFVGDVLVEAG